MRNLIFSTPAIPGWLVIICGILLLTSCSSKNLEDQEPPDFRMSVYATYIFGSMGDTSSEDLRFRSIQFEERVKAQLRFILPQKGMEQTAQDPDVLIYFFTLPERDEDFQISALPYSSGLAYDIADVPQEHNFIIDFVDRNQNILVWRTSGRIELENEERRNRMLPDLLKDMLQDIPT